MKIFSSAQIHEWDQATISNEQITSVELMERAASKCAEWMLKNIPHQSPVLIFCGSGNNGGDGLAIARLLLKEEENIFVYILSADKRSAGCDINLNLLREMQVVIEEIISAEDFPELSENDVVIDALFGTGLNKPLQGMAQLLAQYINESEAKVVSIDVPSGLFVDQSSKGNTIIQATQTLSFQCYKLAFMMAENAACTGKISMLDIGLNKTYYEYTGTDTYTIDKSVIKSFFKSRKQFTHKYSYGHALLYAGSRNMMGAALLCAKSCLRSGAGLVTLHTEAAQMPIIQTALPEAISSSENNFNEIIKKKSAIAIGPGLEINAENANLVKKVLTGWHAPVVIDASAITLLAPQIDLLAKRKDYPTILTPHTREFEKLFGKCANDFERMGMALQKAIQYDCYIILKGHHSLIACPDGKAWFNTTGNSGMATAGSGDVLTGIITGLLCQGYVTKQACLLGVYLHGLAGDFAAEVLSQEAMIASDITDYFGKAFKTLY